MNQKTGPRLALIGAGKWGKNFIRTVQNSVNAELVCVVSNNPETANIVDCNIVGEWETIMHPKLVDGVIIATPPDTHAEICIAALNAGIAVLCEKPLALSFEDTQKIADSLSPQSIFMVDHIYLYNPAFRALLDNLGEVKKIHTLKSCGGNNGPFRQGYDPLWDYGPHDIAMMFATLGVSYKNVEARKLQSEVGEGGLYEVKVAYGNANAILTFGNAMKEKNRWFEVHGEGGVLRFDELSQNKVTLSGQAITYPSTSPLEVVVEEFITRINSLKPDPSQIEISLASAALLERVAKQVI